MKQLGGFAVGIMLIWAPVAYAQAPPVDTYGGPGSVVGDVVGGAPPAGGPPSGDVLGEVVTGGGEADGGAPDVSTPAEEGAGGVGGVTEGDVPGQTAPGGGPTAAARGTLPFTGLDLALMLAGGVLLLGVGLCVRRLSRPVV